MTTARVHSWLSPECEVRTSAAGSGVFARHALPPQTCVAVWGGVVRTEDELKALAAHDGKFNSHAICVGEGFYFTWDRPGIDGAEMFNHSCDPNVGVRGQIVVVARRTISKGEELTFDYDTTETTPQPWKCHCGSVRCRGSITGRGWADPSFVRANAGYLAFHIAELARRAGHLSTGNPTATEAPRC